MGGFASVWLGPWVRRCWPRLCVHLQVLAGHACDSEAMGEAHSLHTPCNNLPFCPHPAPTGALGQDGWAWVSGAAAAHDGSESTTLEAYGLADFVVHTIRCVAGRPRLVGLLSQESSLVYSTLPCRYAADGSCVAKQPNPHNSPTLWACTNTSRPLPPVAGTKRLRRRRLPASALQHAAAPAAAPAAAAAMAGTRSGSLQLKACCPAPRW